MPASARKESAGASPLSTARSKTDGVRPSITIRTSFLVSGKDSEPRVAPACAPAKPECEEWCGDSLGVAEPWDQAERRDDEADERDEGGDPELRAAAAEGPGDDR